MFSVTVETTFCATHQLRLPSGEQEPLHGHDWRVRAGFRRAELDPHGMVVDFHAAEEALRHAVAGWQQRHLNDDPAFAGRNPTAEVVAQEICIRLRRAGFDQVYCVEVTEAPGCVARYECPTATGEAHRSA